MGNRIFLKGIEMVKHSIKHSKRELFRKSIKERVIHKRRALIKLGSRKGFGWSTKVYLCGIINGTPVFSCKPITKLLPKDFDFLSVYENGRSYHLILYTRNNPEFDQYRNGHYYSTNSNRSIRDKEGNLINYLPWKDKEYTLFS